MLRIVHKQASNYVLGERLFDACASPCKGRVLGCACALQLWPQEHLPGGGKDANQQEVKLSTRQQDWRPEVSGVTCQAKEITACHRPTKDCPRHSPAKHAVSTELRQWWHDLTRECCLSEPFGESGLFENNKTKY